MVALEPRTSSLIIPGCEKKVEERKQIRIRNFAGHSRSSSELNEIIRNKERKKGKGEEVDSRIFYQRAKNSATTQLPPPPPPPRLTIDDPLSLRGRILEAFDEDKREQNERHSRCSLLSRTTLLLIVVLCNCHDQLLAASWAVCHDHDDSLFDSSHTTPHTSIPINISIDRQCDFRASSARSFTITRRLIQHRYTSPRVDRIASSTLLDGSRNYRETRGDLIRFVWDIIPFRCLLPSYFSYFSPSSSSSNIITGSSRFPRSEKKRRAAWTRYALSN